MKSSKYFKKYFLIILFITILISFIIICILLFKQNKKLLELSHEKIISNIGEPYLMEDSISPLNITLTSDLPNENGGLSYLKNYTNELNKKLVYDYYKDSYNIELPKDTKIIFGAGTTMIIAATYYALQKKENRIIKVNTDNNVFYVLHKKLTYPAKNVEWVDKDSYSDLAVIVSPSNPLGIITDPKSIGKKYQLYDVVYDKFLFTGKYTSINNGLYEEFSKNNKIFITLSFSKLGMPGVRFGFLLTRDEKIAKYAEEYVNILSVRYPGSCATIARLSYYKYFRNKSWQNMIYNTISERRKIFIIFAKKYNIRIYNETNLVPYMYTNKSVDWWIKNFNVETRKGSDFNDLDDNSRFNLMISNNYWNEFLRRFTKQNIFIIK